MSLLLAGVVVLISDARVLAHTDLTVEQARDLIASTADLVVVDVREPSEYCDARGHSPGALNYPLTSGVLQARYAELPMDRPILVVCRSGGRSNVAANFLDSKGFPEVYDMNGGMNAWLWETVPCKYSGGSGTADDPYQIATAADLIALGETPEDYDKHFILTADIDLDPNLPGGKVFDKAVIGGWDSYFGGVFDGNGHRIMNMTISGIRCLGLFGRVRDGAEVCDLGLENVSVVGVTGWVQDGIVKHLVESKWVGGLAGYNSGSLTRCYSTGAVRGEESVGGLVGMNWRPITDCYSTASVRGSESWVGGLVGFNEDHVHRCYSTGAVSGGASAGGLVGITGGVGGSTGGTVAYCFWDTQTSGQLRSSGGIGKTTAEMQTASTFLVWGTCEHEGVWTIDEGRDYPRLSWENRPGKPIAVSATLSGLLPGAGTEGDPYQIHTADDLRWVGLFPCEWDKHFVLMADIDLDPSLPGGKVFDEAVIAGDAGSSGGGFEGTPFRGIFDGAGHTISRLVIEGEGCLGLFGYLVSGATVKNLGLVDVRIAGSGGCVGGLVGVSFGHISTSHSTGVVSGDRSVGGLAGASGGTITSSYSSGAVHGDYGVGGLAGHSAGAIVACHASSDVTGGEGLGGLVGETSYGAALVRCHSTGTVEGDDYVGGLVGINGDDACIAVSHSRGAVRGNGYVGGLAGENRGSIVVSHSTCAVSGSQSTVGGFVGYNNWGFVTTCYSSGTVTGDSSVGGFVGLNRSGCITGSYSTGVVVGMDDVGGFAGRSDPNDPGSIAGCFWDMETSGLSGRAGGPGRTTAQMQDRATFLASGWDFVDETLNGTCDYWQMAPGSYPELRFQDGTSPIMSEGLGTADKPYLIRDARDLGTVWFEPLAHYRLDTSVDLSGVVWSMAVVPWFGGVLDGDGHAISSLCIRGNGHLGLFGELGSAAVISHLGLEAVDVDGTGDYVGGLAGYCRGPVAMCYSVGTIRGGRYVGGLAGLADYASYYDDAIAASYSAGTISGDFSVGGLVGINRRTVTRCYSTCVVSGRDSVGGLVGQAGAAVSESYSSGSVAGDMNVGGLVGQGPYSPQARKPQGITSFWDTQTSGQSTSARGTGKTTSELQSAATFLDAGWDFVDEAENGADDIWRIDEGNDYPRLWWEAQISPFSIDD